MQHEVEVAFSSNGELRLDASERKLSFIYTPNYIGNITSNRVIITLWQQTQTVSFIHTVIEEAEELRFNLGAGTPRNGTLVGFLQDLPVC